VNEERRGRNDGDGVGSEFELTGYGGEALVVRESELDGSDARCSKGADSADGLMLGEIKGREDGESSAQGMACSDEAGVGWQGQEPGDDIGLDRFPGAVKPEVAAR
jgi:hypothetical protein